MIRNTTSSSLYDNKRNINSKIYQIINHFLFSLYVDVFFKTDIQKTGEKQAGAEQNSTTYQIAKNAASELT